MLLAEELTLVAIRPDLERPVRSSKEYVDIGLRGLLVAELTLAGRVRIVDERARVSDAGPTGDDLLDETLTSLAAHDKKFAGQLGALDKDIGGVWERLTDRLAARGHIDKVERRTLGLIRTTRYRPDAWTRDAIVDRLHKAGTVDDDLDERTALLLALVGPTQLLEIVFPARSERKHAKQRVAAALDATRVGPEIKDAIQDLETLIIVAITAGAVAGSN